MLNILHIIILNIIFVNATLETITILNTFNEHAESNAIYGNNILINDNCWYNNNITHTKFGCKNNYVVAYSNTSSSSVVNVCYIKPVIPERLAQQLGSTYSINSYLTGIAVFANTALRAINGLNFTIQFMEPDVIDNVPVYNSITTELGFINNYDKSNTYCGKVIFDVLNYEPIVGIAYIGGMCSIKYNGFVVSSPHIHIHAHVFAHELGHIMNATHTSETQCGNDLMWEYIHDDINYYSVCSSNVISHFIDNMLLTHSDCFTVRNHTDVNNDDNNNTDDNKIILIPVLTTTSILFISIIYAFYIIIFKNKHDKLSSVPHH